MRRRFTLNQTGDARYDKMGITDHILQHAGKHEGVLQVIDVGCSDGSAAKNTKQLLLKKHGVKIHITGIDDSPAVAADACDNLDHFESENVMCPTVDRYVGKADIVICANVANPLYQYFLCRNTKRIITRCSEFLKTGGILITDATDKRSMSDAGLVPSDALCPKRPCLTHGLYTLFRSIILRKADVYEKPSSGGDVGYPDR